MLDGASSIVARNSHRVIVGRNRLKAGYLQGPYLKGGNEMSTGQNVRMNWLKGMYIYTIILSGGFGLGMLVVPDLIKSVFRWPVNEPIVFGIVGSIYLTFGILSIFGVRSPLKFVPILLIQLFYKSIWFIGIMLPLLVTGQFPVYAIPLAVIFTTYIIGDIIAIPFSQIFEKEQ